MEEEEEITATEFSLALATVVTITKYFLFQHNYNHLGISGDEISLRSGHRIFYVSCIPYPADNPCAYEFPVIRIEGSIPEMRLFPH